MTQKSAAVALAGLLALGWGAVPASAEGSALAVDPAAGTDDTGRISLVTSAGCPAPADHVLVRISGARFPEGSNAIGMSALSIFNPAANGAGLVLPLDGTWDSVARANFAPVPLEGTAKLTLICTDFAGGQSFGEMTGEVRFDPVAGGPSRYDVVGGPALLSGIPLTEAEVTAQQAAAQEAAAQGAAAQAPDPGQAQEPVPAEGATAPDSAMDAAAGAPADDAATAGADASAPQIAPGPEGDAMADPGEATLDRTSVIDAAPARDDGGSTAPLALAALAVAGIGAGIAWSRVGRARRSAPDNS